MPFICIGPVCIPWNVAIPALLLVGMPLWNALPEQWRFRITAWWNYFVDAFYEVFPALDKRRKSIGHESLNGEQVALLSDQIKGAAGSVLEINSMEMWAATQGVAKDARVALVVKFSAEWCKPCKRIAPHYALLAKEYAGDSIFCHVDVDEMDELAAACGAIILPTFQDVGVMALGSHLEECVCGHFMRSPLLKVYDADGGRLQAMSGADESKLTNMLSESIRVKKAN